MKFTEWEPVYREICADFGFSPDSDSMSVRILKAVTPNLDLCDEDAVIPLMKSDVTVVGDAPCLEDDLVKLPVEGTLICSGSAVLRMLRLGKVPEIVVTDLDATPNAQLEASSEPAVTLILAHGDN
ncbi:MAG: DNA transporter, partial [archaeon]|nr:DNA transporter [archaeon]